MFLFLLIAFMVVWALSLAVWTQLAFCADDNNGQAEIKGPLAGGSHSIWINIQSRVRAMARVVGGCSALPNSDRQLRGSGEQPRRLCRQESSAGVLRRSALPSWSRELRKAVATATHTQFDERLTTELPAQRRCKPRGEVGRCLMSLAQ